MEHQDHSFSRRHFLKRGSSAGIGLTTALSSACEPPKQQEERKEYGELNERSAAHLSLFGLQYPFFQAAPGGEKLAIAIAKAGGMGCVGLGWLSPEEAYATTLRMNNETDGNYYASYLLHFEPNSLNKAIEAGCPTFQFSWGLPTGEMVTRIKDAGAKLGVQVSSKQNAEKALELEPDFLFCQGLEAGGHIQATQYLKDALPEVLEVAGDVPVLVSGGISTGHDIRNALQKGAAGAVMGSRFIATRESDISDFCRQQLNHADGNSTVYTNCFSHDWNAMHRVLRNTTFLDWEAAGCPLAGNKPGEGEVIGKRPNGEDIYRYAGHGPWEGVTGDLESMCMYAGQGVSEIKDIPAASELIERLWKEFLNA